MLLGNFCPQCRCRSVEIVLTEEAVRGEAELVMQFNPEAGW